VGKSKCCLVLKCCFENALNKQKKCFISCLILPK
jgi:hypothetical protein